MKVKNYNDKAFESLVTSVNKHIDNGNAFAVLVKMMNELDETYPGIKDLFIKSMGRFMTHWFEIVNDSKSCSLKLRSKILSWNIISQYSDFDAFTVFCYDKINDAVNPYTGDLYTDNILSYLSSTLKAVIQCSRRNIGLDCNSKKHKNFKDVA